MLNDAFLSEQAEHLASRVERVSNGSMKSRIESAFRLALGRWPNGDEAAICSDLLNRQGRFARRAERLTPQRIKRQFSSVWRYSTPASSYMSNR